MKDQVMTMKTHTESSKSELSSGTFGPSKVGDQQVAKSIICEIY